MSIAAAVEAARATAEALMTDTCTITRAGGEPVYDATTDTYTYPTGSTVYEGKCKVRSRQAMAATPEAGEGVVVVARRELHLPLAGEGVSDVQVDDSVTITSSSNPNLTGKRLRVADLGEDQTHQTARRLGVEQQ